MQAEVDATSDLQTEMQDVKTDDVPHNPIDADHPKSTEVQPDETEATGEQGEPPTGHIRN